LARPQRNRAGTPRKRRKQRWSQRIVLGFEESDSLCGLGFLCGQVQSRETRDHRVGQKFTGSVIWLSFFYVMNCSLRALSMPCRRPGSAVNPFGCGYAALRSIPVTSSFKVIAPAWNNFLFLFDLISVHPLWKQIHVWCHRKSRDAVVSPTSDTQVAFKADEIGRARSPPRRSGGPAFRGIIPAKS